VSISIRELLMRTLFHDRAIMQDDNEVGIADRAEAVGDHNTRAGEAVQISIHQALGRHIEMTGCLVEEKKRGSA
jgi:hypothetical protein